MPGTSEASGSFASGLHGIVLSFPVALFTTALAADAAYLGSAEIQWSNFASWSIAGALVFGGLALLWGLVDWLRFLAGRAARGAWPMSWCSPRCSRSASSMPSTMRATAGVRSA